MYDQASHLRRLVRREQHDTGNGRPRRPRLVTVTGGKGGVGTTTVAVNLAVVLAQQGQRTLLVDADPAGGDAAMLCCLGEHHSLADLLAGRQSIHDVLQSGPDGIQVLPGDWASTTLSQSSAESQKRLLEIMRGLDDRFDLIVVDAGNGLNRIVPRFWQAADLVVLVTSPEPTAVMDSYASVKVLAPEHQTRPIYSLVNFAPDPAAGREVHDRLSRACWRFRAIQIQRGGSMPSAPLLVESGKSGEPFVLAEPQCIPANQLRRLGQCIIDALAGSAAEPAAVSAHEQAAIAAGT